jgi:hypothetical protein
MYLELQKYHVSYLVPIIEKRLQLLKNRILKKFGADWYDFEPHQIEIKISEKSDEYFRLTKIIKDLYKQER